MQEAIAPASISIGVGPSSVPLSFGSSAMSVCSMAWPVRISVRKPSGPIVAVALM